jgi:hypothetical protein
VGTCFGFSVRSTLPFSLLRDGPGTPLEVSEAGGEPAELGTLVREWGAKAGETLTTRLYTEPGRDRFWLDRVGSFEIDPARPAIAVPRFSGSFANPVWRESIMWGTPAAVCAVRRGLVSVHAASVDVGGKAVILSAPGTYGKTTLSGAFHRAGFRLLSDDMVTLRLDPEPAVFPGPAILRLRRDVHENLEFPDMAAEHKFGRKVGLVLSEERRGTAAPVPLAAIVLLRKGEDAISLRRVPQPSALRDLFALSFKGILDHERSFEDLAALVSRVPVWDLERPLEYASLSAVVDRIVETCLRS